MLTLNDGRAELWQWDTGRTLAVDADCSQVHFSNKVFGRSIDVDVTDGAAIIPDILLQTDKDLNVWAFVGTAENGYTKISKTFKVNRRNKPADYVFTPVEQTTIAEIAAIAQSVRDDADAGRFNGAQGPIGPQGPQGAPGANGKDAVVDSTLTQSGQAADAQAVGDKFRELSEEKANQADVDELKEDFVNYENSLLKLVESNYDGIIEFKIGVWSRIEGKYVLSDDTNNRFSADLRPLNLKAGDTVGIIDYNTYSIAFGDNDNDMPNHKPWYANGYNSSDITADDSNTEPNVILVKRNDEGLITQTDIYEISKQFHCTSKKTNMTFSKIAIDEINKRIEKNKNSFLHFSFDDVSLCLINLSNSNLDSIFDEPFFNMLKGFHDRYNTVFSLYVWNISELSNIPAKYKKEFTDNSDWLKFGFHALTSGSLADASYETALNEYNSFVNTIYEKCGGINSIDRMPRLNYFGGSLDACRALCDAECGCIGFLNTYDSRNAYYLNSDVLSYLRNHSKYSDINNGIQFMSTVMRLDWFVSGFSSSYTYNKPVKDNPYDELVYRYNDPAFADLYHNLIVFTHEWKTYNSDYTLINDMVDRIEQVCKFGYDYNYDNDYPQNRVEDIRNYKLSNDNLYFDWEFGAIDSGGIIVESSTRVRTKPIHAKNLVVKVPNGYKVNIYKYSSDNVSDSTFISKTDWTTKSQILNDKAWYVIVVSTIDDTATIDIGDNFVINADLIN